MSKRYFTLFLLTLVLAACGSESLPEAGTIGAGVKKPVIFASNYPLYFFAREIAGDSAEVILPPMEGDPANWKPGSEVITRMQSADLIILNGAGYENWLSWVSLPQDILLDTSAGLGDRLISLQDETIHQHGPGGEHSHQGTAFTIWLDPGLAMEQARAIERAISELIPQKREMQASRLADLEARLAALDVALESAFEAFGDQALLFSHPVYQYLLARYELNGASVHWEPGEDPGIKAWIEFGELLRRHPANKMIWEDEPGDQVTARLKQLDVLPVPFHTASNAPDKGDYFDVMQANIERLNLQ